MKDKKGSIWFWVLLIVFILLVIGLVTYYFVFYNASSSINQYNSNLSITSNNGGSANNQGSTPHNIKNSNDAIPNPPALPN